MPIYEFKCVTCGLFEVISSRPSPHVCPKCGAKATKRVLSVSNAHFKGSGFYETDYKKKTGRKE